MDNCAIRQWIEQHTERMTSDIIRLINIPSVSLPQPGDHPYGEGCARVLDQALSICQGMGLKTQNHQYHCATARWSGRGSGCIGIFAHLDIVPEGEGWSIDPFGAQVRDGWIVGRGSADNKGPAVAAIYAVRYLMEAGIRLDHDILLFLGCNEEKGMRDVEYYTAHYPMPDLSFTPDARFPVCNGEKGMMELEIRRPLPPGAVLNIKAGVASNSVPDRAEANLELPEDRVRSALKGRCCTAEEEGGTTRVTCAGKAGHAAFPQGTENAVVALLSALVCSGLLNREQADCLRALQQILSDTQGIGIGIPYRDDLSGALTHIGGITRVQGGQLVQNIDIRYPVTMDASWAIKAMANHFQANGFSMDLIKNDPPTHIPVDDPLVRELCRISNTILCRNDQPYTMGGGTYARKLRNAVAYGPGVPDEMLPFGPGRGGGHQPDEAISIRHLQNAVEIYVQALIAMDSIKTQERTC